jgi:hypothetical protein
MAKKTKRGRKQDRARVAGKQGYEVRYEAKKKGEVEGQGEARSKEGRPKPQKGGNAERPRAI